MGAWTPFGWLLGLLSGGLLGLLSGAQDFLINSVWDGRLDSFRVVAWASSGVGCLNFFLGWLLELLFGLVAWASCGRPRFLNQLLQKMAFVPPKMAGLA